MQDFSMSGIIDIERINKDKTSMKKCTSSWMGALLVLAIGICSCSDDSDVNKPTPIYNYSQLRLEEEYTITQENGLTIRRDESGRVNAIETFLEPNTNYLIAPHYDAEIDAHTGQLVIILINL